MRIAHVIPSFYPAYYYGGPIRSSYELCRNLALSGSDVRVLTTDANGLDHILEVEKNNEVLFDEGFRVRYCRRWFRHSVSPRLLASLRSYIRWADVVHLTGIYNFPSFPTLLLCRALRKPVVWSPRGALQRWQGSSRRSLKSLWDFLWYHLADRSRLSLHFTSDEEARETLARFPGLHSAVIPNGVDVPATLARTEQNGNLRLLYIGRLDPKKGIEALLTACNMMPATSGNWQLAIAGAGPPAYVTQLKQQISALGLDRRVQLKGEVLGEAKKTLFENSDVAVIPSYTENFAIVVAEALAHAVPVIASKGTPWSGVETHNCGFWVENDPQTLASTIRRIRSMSLGQMGQRGREWMQNEFSWASVSKRMLAFYRECAQRAAAPARPGG
jgi:glycosyltransferase involved in cell wall biosynthesis